MKLYLKTVVGDYLAGLDDTSGGQHDTGVTLVIAQDDELNFWNSKEAPDRP